MKKYRLTMLCQHCGAGFEVTNSQMWWTVGVGPQPVFIVCPACGSMHATGLNVEWTT